jgi:hypothetical protein
MGTVRSVSLLSLRVQTCAADMPPGGSNGGATAFNSE